MLPIILAEELAGLRVALRTYRMGMAVKTTAQTAYDMLHSSSEDANVQDQTEPDEYIFYFISTRAMFHYIAMNTDSSLPTPKELDSMVAKAIQDPAFTNSMPDPYNRLASFVFALIGQLRKSTIDLAPAFSDALQHQMTEPICRSHIEAWLSDTTEKDGLAKRLKEEVLPQDLNLHVGPSRTQLLDWAFAELDSKLRPDRVAAILNSGAVVLLADSWIAIIYAALSQNASIISQVAASSRRGAVAYNVAMLPAWYTGASAAVRRPTFMSHTITKYDVDNAAVGTMAQRGYDTSPVADKMLQKWSERVFLPPDPGKDAPKDQRDAYEELAKDLILSAAAGGKKPAVNPTALIPIKKKKGK